MKKLFGSGKKSDFQGEVSAQHDGDCSSMLGLSDLYSPEENVQTHIRDIADVLCEMSVVSTEQIEKIRSDEKNQPGRDIERIILDSGFANDKQILQAKASLYGFKFQDVQVSDVDRDMFDKLEIEYIRTNHIMAVSVVDEVLVVATSEPTNVFVIDEVKRRLEMNVEVIVCCESDIDAACEEFDETKLNYDVDDIMHDMAEIEVVQETEEDVSDLERSAAESPVIKFVNYLITNAVHEGASDIHIEAKRKFTRIRCRIDGVLFESMEAPAKMHAAIISRIKIMSNLDISERRVPQDGKISVIMGGRAIDLRVSILPTSHGEKVVIRILDSKSLLRGLDNSGMEPDVQSEFLRQIAMPHGILLVTGPTGSGKSTTLYSALGQMDGSEMNISTVEDPVEYDLESCNQVQINEQIGLTFANSLRSLLRQDPDIIMLGEIRDQETARVAVQAALTGHLVLSTLHTNDAPSSISRLINIGVEPFLLAASLNGILAQRLVRRICPNCIEDYNIPDEIWRYLDNTGINAGHLKRGAGCDQCRQSGYSGRAGIYELLIMDDTFRSIVNQNASSENLKQAFFDSDSRTLFEDGIEKIKQGITTIDEVLRTTEVCGHHE
jgi:type IV pilus assembly protein PilB